MSREEALKPQSGKYLQKAFHLNYPQVFGIYCKSHLLSFIRGQPLYINITIECFTSLQLFLTYLWMVTSQSAICKHCSET